MSKAIGMIEFKTTSTGVTAADAMVKTSEVEIVEAQTVCPGKYIAIITGDLSAVKAAVDTAVTTYEQTARQYQRCKFYRSGCSVCRGTAEQTGTAGKLIRYSSGMFSMSPS